MRSYLEIINELHQTVESDVMPQKDKELAKKKIRELLDILFPYSD